MSQNWSIKEATPDDIPELLELVVGLAIYEKEPDAVTCTPEMMRKAIFDDKYAHALIVRLDSGKAVALCIYFFTYSTWLGKPGLWVEDIYVVPEMRAAGIGKAVFGHVGEIALQRDCGRVEWCVLKWNTPSIEFYEKKLGSTPQVEWETERLEGVEQIKKLAAFKL
ncbi:hypothetical protein CspHIS471_0703720 [Cutaneotrichosporon sp. HIS471]|nr:hypothetical protein CspHIS471_0703720 [Cutaneotrichosporon sp. HIS471]